MVQKKASVDAWKLKKWHKILAPKVFEAKEVGETMSAEPEKMLGRVIKTTLREVTGNLPHQNVELTFKVSDVKGESVDTEVVGYELNRGYVGRQIRRMHCLIPSITNVTTKDGYVLRIKTLAFGHGKTNVAQAKTIRAITIAELDAAAKTAQFDRLFQDLVFGKIDAEIQKKVRKIYPITKTQVIKAMVITAPQK